MYMYVIHIRHAQIHGNFASWVQACLPENSSENVFCFFLVLNLFYSFTEGF